MLIDAAIQGGSVDVEPVGFIKEMHGPVVDVDCVRLPPLHPALLRSRRGWQRRDMSRRREVQRRLATLGEIRGIILAMKHLALIETRILKGFLGAQERAVASIERAVADFLIFYGQALRAPRELRRRYVLLGSGNFSHAPDLNLAPFDLFSQLDEHYLYAVLHQVFYSALMAENRQRLQHMDQAIHRLEESSGGLKLKYNALRQEEIIEEIEVILLSAELLAARESI